jgi:hypothetical protein
MLAEKTSGKGAHGLARNAKGLRLKPRNPETWATVPLATATKAPGVVSPGVRSAPGGIPRGDARSRV